MEFGDPMFNMDVGFYMFKAPLIGQLLYYGATLVIIFTIYTVIYYIVTFNIHFEGIDGGTLRKNTFIKQLLFNALLIVIFIAGIIFFNMQNMVINGFLNLDDKMETTLIGAGAVDGIKLWGYRIFAVVMVISVYMGIKFFKKNNTKNVLKSLAVVPVYLIGLFIVLVGYNIIFISSSELDKQKEYISKNIEFTKTAYDIKIDEKQVTHTGTITEEEADNNEEIISNIPIVTENVVTNNLLQTQTSTGYYTYNKASLAMYDGELAYISARELDSGHVTEEYTHGYGAVIAGATETDVTGNIKYISREFENEKVKEPRIYYGVENKGAIAVANRKNEFDYPKGGAQFATYTYQGEGGLTLGFLDKFCVSVKEGNLGLLFSGKESKVLVNRNVIKRAKKIMPNLMYDEKPYIVISDDGKIYWVIDAYTTSNEYPYSQKTRLAYGNETKEINYIRNSIKVVINAFDGETNFYITDKTDPIAMVYNKMYQGVFKDGSEIPEDIAKHFIYPEFLYDIQAKVLNLYHDVSADVLYRANDVWEIASYSNLITRTAGSKMKPYYTMVKTDEGNKLGLVIAYNQYGKESLNAYVVGTFENGKNKLSLFKFSGDVAVLRTNAIR
ncbi:MAG: COG1615 family transporter [Clostridia bacterium]|nr:COG1615 family transporter [Clostridia bacterium]